MASEIRMPQLGLTMTEGVIAQWLKREGDAVAVGDPLYMVETDKLATEVQADASGVLLKIVQPEGAEVPVQGVVAYVGGAGENVPAAGEPVRPEASAAAAASSKADAPALPSAQPSVNGERIKASPLAKKIAAERGIDLSSLVGSGPGGRIVRKDVASRVGGSAVPVAVAAAVSGAPGSQPVRRQRLSAMRRAIARNMTLSWTTAPVVTYHRSADVTALAVLKDSLSASGRKISYTDILCKLVAGVLMEYPYVNASIDGDEVVFHEYVNMGVAVALEDGLVVPVIRDVQRMGIGAISAAVKDLAARARTGALLPDELTGGTFTITNLGMFGMEAFSPIVNQPQSAILGVNSIVKQPVETEDGGIVMRPRMTLSMTADHRAVDGAVAAQFLKKVCDLIENPGQMLL